MSDVSSIEGVFGRYVLLQRIAADHRSEIFRAVLRGARGYRVPVSLERLLPRLSDDRDLAETYAEELRLAANFNHPNIVQVIAIGSLHGIPYRVIEYVPGRSLAAILDAMMRAGLKPPAIEMTCALFVHALDALEYAHNQFRIGGGDQGDLPRGTCPRNLQVTYGGEVKIAEFGIAEAGQTMVHNVGGLIKGMSTYLSPEQARNEHVDDRSDLFSLGICFYELLTLQPMYAASGVEELLQDIFAARFPAPSVHNPDVPPELEAILLKVLAADPEDRFADARTWRLDLERFLGDHDLRASRDRLVALVEHLFPGSREREERRIEQELRLVESLEEQGRIPVLDDSSEGLSLENHPTFTVMPRHKGATAYERSAATDGDPDSNDLDGEAEENETEEAIKSRPWDDQQTLDDRPSARRRRDSPEDDGPD